MPKNCTVSDSYMMTNYYTNLSETFLTASYFNYINTTDDVDLQFHDIAADAEKVISETESTSSVMIVVFSFLIILGILGLIVEKTNLANKPNLNDDEDNLDDKVFCIDINNVVFRTLTTGRTCLTKMPWRPTRISQKTTNMKTSSTQRVN